MCDLDYEWFFQDSSMVKIRRPHRCATCGNRFPAKTIMRSASGFGSDGPHRQWDCQACVLMTDETYEGTPLHICSGGLDSGDYDNAWERYHYVRDCLEDGEPVIMAVLELIEKGFLKDAYPVTDV